jgi:WD40 repeat protein
VDYAGDEITSLCDLATDCLRFLTYFFYPIQQCAQQVYYTALPLSPTSSHLRKSCLRSVAGNQLSHVTAFLGAPDAWGLLLRTINVRPRRLTCIATSAQRIVAACEDIVNIYDAVTFVLQQSLRAPKAVTKIQGSPDESTLFFAHPRSLTIWDVQTGGITRTFTTRSKITDIAVSPTGDRIACGSSDGSVKFLNIHTKGEGKGFGNKQPIVALLWLSPLILAAATRGTVYIYDIGVGGTLGSFSIPGRVWGLVHSPLSTGEFLVGTAQSDKGTSWNSTFLRITPSKSGRAFQRRETDPLFTWPLTRPGEELLNPMLASGVITCITSPRGVRSFNTESRDPMGNPPLLDAATSVAVSLNRNLVAQAEDSIQIFTLDVLKAHDACNDTSPSHVYPLGRQHIVCLLQPNRHLTILELRTLRELRPNDGTNKLLSVRATFLRGFVAEFGVLAVIEMWRSGSPLPEWAEAADEPLGVLSPSGTRIVTVYSSPRRELRVEDAKEGTILAKLPLKHDDLGMGKVYDVTFDSETRFHLKIDGPGRHVQIPHDIIPSSSGPHLHTITKGEPVLLSEPRETPPYALDANSEWVVDAGSRKVCWISPGNVRRGSGGHFWVGLSLVMVGDDGVVRKLSFKKPDRRAIHNTA